MVLFTLLQNRVVLFPIYFGAAWSPPSPLKPCGPPHYFEAAWSLLYFRAAWSLLLLQSRMVSPLYFRAAWSLLLWLPGLGLNPSTIFLCSPFPTPPTVSYTCQHPHILPALLGCHSKSGQVWPHSMEPIISKLSRRPCNQGELLPSPILGGSHSHLPGSKQGHSYLTYP